MADEGDGLPLGSGAVRALGERGPGRPKGSTNRKTAKLMQYLAGVLGEDVSDPALVLARTYVATDEELANELSCTKLEARRLRVGAAEGLMPYVHGKQPVDIEPGDERLPLLAIFTQAAAVIAGGETAEPMRLAGRAWGQQDQGVSGSESEQSHEGKSHDR